MYLMKQSSIYLHIYEKYKKNFFVSFILSIASVFFFIAYKLRIFLYKIKLIKTHSLPAYIISIGNITSGGTGKTPFTIECAKYFINQGYKVAILSRGYKRNIKNSNGVTLVSDGSDILVDDYEHCGDEPYLIAKKAPKAIVIVGKNKIKTSKAAIKVGAEVLILDDGFQYLKLNRNENIVMLDSYNPFNSMHLLPKGKLRELPDSLHRATAIVISNTDRKKLNENDLNTIKKYAPNTPILEIGYKISELNGINTKRVLNINQVKGLQVLACCGIANPVSFFELLESYEIKVIHKLIYPDHYAYTTNDIETMIKVAKEKNTENIIVTEKDTVKIKDFCEAAPITLWSAKLEVIINNEVFENIFKNKEKVKI